jgi:hypothetical protein
MNNIDYYLVILFIFILGILAITNIIAIINKKNIYNINNFKCTKQEKVIVADANDINNYTKLIEETLKENNEFNDNIINIHNNDPILQIKYQEDLTKITEQEKKLLDKKKHENNKSTLYSTSIEFNQPKIKEILNCENSSISKKEAIPIIDPVLKGYNYMDYTNYNSAYNTDIYILSHTTKSLNEKKNIPSAFNYSFQNNIP